MNGQRQGTKDECLGFLEEIKGMGYQIIMYSLTPVDLTGPKEVWFISVDFRIVDSEGKEIQE